MMWCAGFGAGYLRPAPGTWGSLLAVVIWWFCLAGLPVLLQLMVIVAYIGISLLALGPVLRASDVQDPSWIVADELAGQWLALLFAPAVWWVALLGFALFRLLDITKPGPIGWLDRRLGGGPGVMADDLLAGVVACAVLQLAVLGSQYLSLAGTG